MRRILAILILTAIILCLAIVILKIRVKDNKVEIEFRKPWEIHRLHKGLEKSLEEKVEEIKVKTIGTEKKDKAGQDGNEMNEEDRKRLEEIIEKAR